MSAQMHLQTHMHTYIHINVLTYNDFMSIHTNTIIDTHMDNIGFEMNPISLL